MNRFAIYALTGQGAALAGRIALALQKTSAHFEGQIFLSAKIENPSCHCFTPQTFVRLADCLAANFHTFSCHILICASGIAVRCLAPLLVSKQSDPAVLLLDQRGNFVISLLSGHLGRANVLATELARLINGTPVITTATDTEGLPAIDTLAAASNLRIINPAAIRSVNAALLRGERPWLYDPDNRLGISETELAEYFQYSDKLDDFLYTEFNKRAAVIVNRHIAVTPPAVGGLDAQLCAADNAANILLLEERAIWLGLGCKRGTDVTGLEAFARTLLAEYGLTHYDLAGLASVDLKQDEPALLQLAKIWSLPLRFFSAAELDAVPVPNYSKLVKQLTGSGSVCEAAAILAAQLSSAQSDAKSIKLLIPKRKTNGITAALAGPAFE